MNATEINKRVKEIAKKAASAIKKTGHHRQNKPYTTLTIGIPSREAGSDLLCGYREVKSDTARMERRMLSPDDIQGWLGLDHVDGVKYSGKVWCLAGVMPKMPNSTALFESLEVKLESNLMTLKFRTYLNNYSGV